MKTRTLITQTVLAATALLFAGAAGAGALTLVPDCDFGELRLGAEANDTAPSFCAWGNTANDSPSTEAADINEVFASVLGTGGDPFYFIGKYDRQAGIDGAVPGFTFTAEETGPMSPWDYAFKLVSDYAGQKVDFVLMVKQPEGGQGGMHNVAYAWTGLTLDIDGFYNSFRGDYSHVSGFIRGTFDYDVSEPGTLMLLGAGLLAFAAMRRRVAG